MDKLHMSCRVKVFATYFYSYIYDPVYLLYYCNTVTAVYSKVIWYDKKTDSIVNIFPEYQAGYSTVKH